MRIMIISPIYADSVAALARDHDVVEALNPTRRELAARIGDCEVVVMRSGVYMDADLLTSAARLRLIVRAGAGTDNIDMNRAGELGIRVVTIPEPGAKAVSEMAFALMLSLARNVLEADRSLREGRWRKHEMTGRSLSGKTLGVLGAGSIGSRVGRLGVAWGMSVLGAVERPTPDVVTDLQQQGIGVVPVDELLRRSDYVSVHVPLTDSTRDLLGAEAFARMKPDAYLINLARGGVVDEQALYDALVEGRLAGAALDVHAEEGDGKISPLAGLPNVVLTPHIGAGTVETQQEIGQRVLEIVREYEAGLVHAVAERGA